MKRRFILKCLFFSFMLFLNIKLTNKIMAIISSLDKNQVSDVAEVIYESFENKTGSVPEWVRVMAHCPNVLKGFKELFDAVMKEGEISLNLKWKIALTISRELKCHFCVDVTEKMLKRLGAKEEVLKNSKDENVTEQKILELARDITDNAHVEQVELFRKLREVFSEKQIVEIISVIGLFNYINRFNNTLGILPE